MPLASLLMICDMTQNHIFCSLACVRLREACPCFACARPTWNLLALIPHVQDPCVIPSPLGTSSRCHSLCLIESNIHRFLCDTMCYVWTATLHSSVFAILSHFGLTLLLPKQCTSFTVSAFSVTPLSTPHKLRNPVATYLLLEFPN